MADFSFLKKQSIHSIHCIGIGGAGVSGLAEILVKAGFEVTGSDTVHSPVIQRLEQMGVIYQQGHNPDLIEKSDAIIYSRAVTPANPEMQVAHQRGLPIYARGEFLAELLKKAPLLVVAGSHGKSTTSGWISHTVRQSKTPMNAYLGAIIQKSDSSVDFHRNDLPWILESDESDGSCFLLNPTCLVITNLDADHLETYGGTLEGLQSRMVAWLNELPPNGFAVLCTDDPGVCAILPKLRCRYFTYGFNESADYRLIACQQMGLRTSLCWDSPDGLRHEEQIHLPGQHNALNGLAAWIAVTHFVGDDNAHLMPNWASYPGVNRRMMLHGELALDKGRALLIEDYGHHPTEIKATFDAIQTAWPDRRLVVLFQPHRYTRTRDLLLDFAGVLTLVPNLCLLPIYAAGEQAIRGVSSQHLAKVIEEHTNQLPIVYTDLNQATNAMKSMLQDNDILLLQGAGDVGSLVLRLGVLE